MSQERWVNVGKAIAILAVLIDHTKGYCYTDNYIQIASFFSVSLFILLMGVTTYWSFSKSKISLKMKVGGRILKIISAYALAVLVYLVCLTHHIDLNEYLTYFVHFNIAGPHYYVLLYLQLLLISPLLFYALKKIDGIQNEHKIEFMLGGG